MRFAGLGWQTTAQQAMFNLRGSLSSNEVLLLTCGDSVGQCHVEPGKMGHPPRVLVDFVLCRRGADGDDTMGPIFRWMAGWAKSLGSQGLYRVRDFTDMDAHSFRTELGKLTRREIWSLLF
jgi:hypothetical protein